MSEVVGEKPWRKVFLAALAKTGSPVKAARVAGVTYERCRQLRHAEPGFGRRWKTALKRFHARRARAVDDTLYRLAKDGWKEEVYQGGEMVGLRTKRSVQAMGLYLSAHHPSYRKQASNSTTVNVLVTQESRTLLLSGDPAVMEAACVLAAARWRPGAVEATSAPALPPPSDRASSGGT